MPLTLIIEASKPSESVTLDKMAFFDQGRDKYFKLAAKADDVEVRVPYAPNFVSTWDSDRYECHLFENSYLTAENDIFEIYESTLKGRFGWIFPISALDSNENDYTDHKIFRHYRHIAYQKLLDLNHSITVSDIRQEFKISELFHGLSICILSRDEIAKLNGFKITNYALSFLKYDYLVYSTAIRGKKVFKKDWRIEEIRKGSHKITIKKAAFDITVNQYTSALFIDHVYQTENILTKYILLYQILEHFIQELGDKQLEEIIEEYNNKRITKNDIKERIGKAKNDRSLLKETFARTSISKDVRDHFLQKCKYLFTDIKLNVSQNFEDALYDLRNLITHNFRLLTGKTDELNELIYLFELVMLDLLVGFNEKIDRATEEGEVTVEQTKL